MKKLCSLTAFLLFLLPAFASHIVGGEMTYEYLGPGSDGTSSYRIVLRLFRDRNCYLTNPNCADMPGNVSIGIYKNDGGAQFPGKGEYYKVIKGLEANLPVVGYPPCISNPPELNYQDRKSVV